MSQQNVEIVRSIYAVWERGDFSSAEWAHPEIEFVRTGGLAPGSWTGLAGMLQAHREWLSAWESVRIEVDEYREIDDERVLVLVRPSGRGKTSGLELARVHAKGANLLHIRDGKLTRFVLYADRDRALADLGLKE